MWLDPLSYRLFKGAGYVSASEGRGPVVLMYHSIEAGTGTPESMWAVSASSFAAQMDLLHAHGWKTFLFRDLLLADELPPKSVVITFDDGFADNFENGFKTLQARDMCATWFIVSGEVGGSSHWLDSGHNLKPMLNHEQIIEMSSAGMEIGAHTRSHASLSDLDVEAVYTEVNGAKEDLERLLGQPVASFAYPFGRYNSSCLDAVKRAGFSIACTTETGWFGSQKDLLKVRRVPVFSYDTLSSFARKMAFADPDVRWPKMVSYLSNRVVARVKSC